MCAIMPPTSGHGEKETKIHQKLQEGVQRSWILWEEVIYNDIPHVIEKVKDADGNSYIIMDFLNGGSVADLISKIR